MRNWKRNRDKLGKDNLKKGRKQKKRESNKEKERQRAKDREREKKKDREEKRARGNNARERRGLVLPALLSSYTSGTADVIVVAYGLVSQQSAYTKLTQAVGFRIQVLYAKNSLIKSNVPKTFKTYQKALISTLTTGFCL